MAAKGDAMKATDIKERPILFSGPMIRAILRDENPKTQTRRVAMDLPSHPAIARWVCDSNGWWEPVPHSEQVREQYITTWPAGFYRCKYGKPGDRLWVKEKHVLLDRDGWSDPARPRDAMISGRRNGVGYADFEHDPDSERCRKELGYKWRPSIHMPRWASRITLEITEVRVQRLQGISEEDAKAEGLLAQAGDGTGPGAGYKWNGIGYHGAGFGKYGPTFHVSGPQSKKCVCNVGGPTPAQCAFRELWDSINGKRSPWASNPWVWALTFKRLEQP